MGDARWVGENGEGGERVSANISPDPCKVKHIPRGGPIRVRVARGGVARGVTDARLERGGRADRGDHVGSDSHGLPQKIKSCPPLQRLPTARATLPPGSRARRPAPRTSRCRWRNEAGSGEAGGTAAGTSGQAQSSRNGPHPRRQVPYGYQHLVPRQAATSAAVAITANRLWPHACRW